MSFFVSAVLHFPLPVCSFAVWNYHSSSQWNSGRSHNKKEGPGSYLGVICILEPQVFQKYHVDPKYSPAQYPSNTVLVLLKAAPYLILQPLLWIRSNIEWQKEYVSSSSSSAWKTYKINSRFPGNGQSTIRLEIDSSLFFQAGHQHHVQSKGMGEIPVCNRLWASTGRRLHNSDDLILQSKAQNQRLDFFSDSTKKFLKEQSQMIWSYQLPER